MNIVLVVFGSLRKDSVNAPKLSLISMLLSGGDRHE